MYGGFFVSNGISRAVVFFFLFKEDFLTHPNYSRGFYYHIHCREG